MKLDDQQIQMLKIKSERLESHCINYQRVIREIKVSFDEKQQNDEKRYRDIIRYEQNKNDKLGAECFQLKKELYNCHKQIEYLKMENDRLSNYATNHEILMNNLLKKQIDLETNFKMQNDLKKNQLNSMIDELNTLKSKNIILLNQNHHLSQINKEHDILKTKHSLLKKNCYKLLTQNLSQLMVDGDKNQNLISIQNVTNNILQIKSNNNNNNNNSNLISLIQSFKFLGLFLIIYLFINYIGEYFY